MRRVVLVGATGVFGRRLAENLARRDGLDLVLAARSARPLAELAERLRPTAQAKISVAMVDRERPQTITSLAPWAVVDAAGPFAGARYGLARAAIEAGAHWLDLADSRAFVAGFASALDELAREHRVFAVSGASSSPALTDAAMAQITAGWRRVDRAASMIAPGAQAPGLSLARTVLAQAGQPVSCLVGGRWVRRRAWSGAHWRTMPGLGRRLLVLADTPDLDVLPRRATSEALFFAGVEPPLLQRLIWLAAWPVRVGLVPSLAAFARLLCAPAALLARWGKRDGGMMVLAEGVGPEGEPRIARWSLTALGGSGPAVPSAAAAAVLTALAAGRLNRAGARACLGLVSLDDILAELAHLPISARAESWRLDRGGLFPAALGDGFDALPATVRQAHAGSEITLTGRAVSASRGFGAWLGRLLLGLPPSGRHAARVDMTLDRTGEVWTRRFGASRFRSRLALAKGELGQFEERFGPAAFRFSAHCDPRGFRWISEGWRLGPLPAPAWLSPRIRARAFDRDGVYRFSVVVAHPWLGVIAAYAGRLTQTPPAES